MRDYSKFGPRFWTGDTGKCLRKLGRDAQVIGAYLFTCPNANMLGLYYLPLATLSHETGISIERSREVLGWLSEAPSESLQSPFEGVYARYDELSETVFVTEMAKHQIGERLVRKDNRHKAVLKELEQYRKTPFFNEFLRRYREDFELQEVPLSKGLRRGSGGPSKPEAGAGAEERTETRTGAGERDARAPADVSRGTAVTEHGTNLTRSAEDIHGELLDSWRHEPAINVVAFERWIAHWEKVRGKLMGSQQRVLQARQLAQNGPADLQLEVVDFCIGQDWKTLAPIADVRAKRNGLSRGAGRKNVEDYDRESARRLEHLPGDDPGPM